MLCALLLEQVTLELGTYCAYSAIRTIANAPSGTHLYSIELIVSRVPAPPVACATTAWNWS